MDIIENLKSWVSKLENNEIEVKYNGLVNDILLRDITSAIDEIEYYRKYLGDSCGIET